MCWLLRSASLARLLLALVLAALLVGCDMSSVSDLKVADSRRPAAMRALLPLGEVLVLKNEAVDAEVYAVHARPDMGPYMYEIYPLGHVFNLHETRILTGDGQRFVMVPRTERYALLFRVATPVSSLAAAESEEMRSDGPSTEISGPEGTYPEPP